MGDCSEMQIGLEQPPSPYSSPAAGSESGEAGRSAQWNDKRSDEEIFRRIDGRNDRRSDQEPEKISENGSRTRQWWLRRPAAGRRTTPPTLGSTIRPSHRQAGEQIRHPRLKGHHPDYDPLCLPVCQTQASALNRFEFWGKKIRIPTRGWARTASPEQADKRGNPDCRRPTSTFGVMKQ